MIIDLFPRQSLLVNENKPLIRKNEHVPDELEPDLDLLVLADQLSILLLQILHTHRRRITHQSQH